MKTVKDVFVFLNMLAPVDLKMDFDNVGILVGSEKCKVEKCLIALDITDEVIDEAINLRANLIVSHHPRFSYSSLTEKDHAHCRQETDKAYQKQHFCNLYAY